MKMKDAVVLVTGANRGLGKALVQATLDTGARRVYAAARDPRQLEALVAAGRSRIVPLLVDITDVESLRAAAAQAPDVAVLYNNAGVLASASALESTPEQIARDFETNFFGTLAATRAFLPALERAAAGGQAALVNVLSVVSLASLPGLGGYSAAKAASFSITQALRADLSRKGIAVHAALPGAIDTDMTRDFAIPKTSPDVVARAIVAGVEADLEEILPDPRSQAVFALWQRDPKELERQIAAMVA
jgi:NAD(P)-dependent dehydrogenase (short-subunit alcohol dehydrogenase family)